MKLLYLSCHSVLEYDEMKLFNEMGVDWFSLGAYINPANPQDNKRPPINAVVKDHFQEIAIQYDRDNLSPDLIAWADVVVVMHITEWITKNLEKLKGKRIIWRTIGQSTADKERDLAPYRDLLQIVRYSPTERNIPGYIGENAMIRFYKDPDEFIGWNGNNRQVISLVQSPVQRGIHCRADLLEEYSQGFPRAIYGTDTEQMSWGKGRIDYETAKQLMRDNRVFLYTGTYPASYTLGFIEAWMTGIPVVALGSATASHPDLVNIYGGQNTYEVDQLITNGVDGFIVNSPEEAKSHITHLLSDDNLAGNISRAGRAKAIELFGKEIIKQQWKEFLCP
jgi:hypothetical protein